MCYHAHDREWESTLHDSGYSTTQTRTFMATRAVLYF